MTNIPSSASGPTSGVKCAKPGCIVTGVLPKCRLCENRICIQHFELVRDEKADDKVGAECFECYCKHPESNHEFSIYL